MGCRFPGDAVNPEKLWAMLLEGRDAWRTVPADRFNAKGWYHPDQARVGSVRILWPRRHTTTSIPFHCPHIVQGGAPKQLTCLS